MKRRHFLATAGTVGIATTVAGGTVVSTAYSSLNATVLLQDFQPEVKTVYESFVAEMTANTKAMDLDNKHVLRSVLPTRIVSQEPKRIVYKNQCGQFVTLSVVKGKERIQIMDKC